MADDSFAAAGGANSSSHTPGKHRGPRFSWTPAFETTFFESLVDSVNRGLREGSTFKQEAWDRAITALINTHNAFAHKTHLINKSDNARKKFRLWRGLREHPDFYYDAASRTVSASEETWAKHLEKEPLARSLKGRPFDHEHLYEILFPDVVGSKGAPKRLTKSRPKPGDGISDLTDQDAPGAGIMDLINGTSYGAASQTHIPPPVLPPATAIPSSIAPPPAPVHPRANSTTMPPRASMGSSSALTPPEDPASHTRKRFQPPDNTNVQNAHGGHQDKRRRTAASAPAPAPYLHSTTGVNVAPPPAANPVSAPAPAPTGSSSQQDGIAVLAEAIRVAKTRPTWAEQAVDIFFHEFNDEDMDLQLKIAEKMLTDENKAMVFCKMPEHLRRHWVRRLREMHNQRMG